MTDQGATQPMSTAPVTRSLERYEVLEQIGHGGMADVYRARDGLLGREVALKFLRGDGASSSDRSRFLAEGRILAGLSHPGLITLLDVGVDDDEQPFLAMELIEGRTLACPLELAEVADIGRQLAESLAYAHRSGVVHRDIKPGNVLIDEDGRVRLADFGIARLVGDTVHLTDAGMTIGTAAYLAPEQVRGDPVDTPADVYSLGLVLIEAITGEPVYTGPPMEAAVARLHCQPSLPEGLPAGWHGLLSSMTSADPAARPTAGDVATHLSALSADGDVLAPTSSGADISPHRRTVRRGLNALASVTLLLTLSLGATPPQAPPAPVDIASEIPRVTRGLQVALDDLHTTLAALGQVRGVDVHLQRINRTLVERKYDAAAAHLRELIPVVQEAAQRGLVDQALAQSAVAAARRLLALLPMVPTAPPPVAGSPDSGSDPQVSPSPNVQKSDGPAKKPHTKPGKGPKR